MKYDHPVPIATGLSRKDFISIPKSGDGDILGLLWRQVEDIREETGWTIEQIEAAKKFIRLDKAVSRSCVSSGRDLMKALSGGPELLRKERSKSSKQHLSRGSKLSDELEVTKREMDEVFNKEKKE